MAFMPPFGLPGIPGAPGQPPFGPPGAPGAPGQPPFGPPGQQGSQQAPTSPPPQSPPPRPLTTSTFAVDPGAIRGCLFRNTYIWPKFGPGFWFFPTFVGFTSVAGFRWTGSRWVYSGYSLRNIDAFTCF